MQRRIPAVVRSGGNTANQKTLASLVPKLLTFNTNLTKFPSIFLHVHASLLVYFLLQVNIHE